jgi:lipoyl(octanoyl) transferase
MHGFALNVNTRLSDYSGIVACGLPGVGVTSLQQLSGEAVAMDDVKAAIADAFLKVLGYEVT